MSASDVARDAGVAADDASDASDAFDADDGALEAATQHVTPLCEGIYGSIVASLDGCCTAVEKQNSDYLSMHGRIVDAPKWCESLFGASLVRGRIRVDDAGVAGCVAAVRANLAAQPACWEQWHATHPTNFTDPPQMFAPQCTDVIVGLQMLGQACAQDFECAAGLACVGWNDRDDGSCQPPRALGETCGYQLGDAGGATRFGHPFGAGEHPLCGSGLRCWPGATCTATADAGAACTYDQDCAVGLVCSAGACSTTYAGAGSKCRWDDSCAEHMFCANVPSDGGAGTCTPRGTNGASCGGAAECEGLCDIAADASACRAFCGAP